MVSRPLHGGRGLKRVGWIPPTSDAASPPSRGARIETINLRSDAHEWGVAPFTGGAD